MLDLSIFIEAFPLLPFEGSRPAEAAHGRSIQVRQTSLSVSIWRGGQTGTFENYSVPCRDNQTVLDVVTYVQRHIDPTLSYRFACRVCMCWSCPMTVNARPPCTRPPPVSHVNPT